MEQSLQKLSEDFKETQFERDKVLQELTRLKQHLLEKVLFFFKFIFIFNNFFNHLTIISIHFRVDL